MNLAVSLVSGRHKIYRGIKLVGDIFDTKERVHYYEIIRKKGKPETIKRDLVKDTRFYA